MTIERLLVKVTTPCLTQSSHLPEKGGIATRPGEIPSHQDGRLARFIEDGLSLRVWMVGCLPSLKVWTVVLIF